MKYIGIDIGGTNLKAGLVDGEGRLLATRKMKVAGIADPAALAWTIHALVQDLCRDYGCDIGEIFSVGVGCPGAVEIRGGSILYTCNLPLRNVPLRRLFHQLSDLPLYIENDANCAALAEYYVGGGRSSKRFITVTLGTGVGGGIVVEGKLLHGAHGSGAEIGHLVLNRDETVPCNCGKRGCVEQYCSATGIVRLAKRHLDSTDAPSSLRTLKNLTCKDIFDAGKAGDKEARIILDRYYAYMGEFLGDVCTTVDPEVVVIGGGVSKAGQVLIDGILPYFHKYVFHAASGARFTLASLGNDAGAYGAFKLALDAFHA